MTVKRMKTLMLLRHAKSAWSDPTVGDHDRPLNERGRKAAARMGRYMAEEALRPDIVLSSTSARTRETWHRLADSAGFDLTPRFENSLYLGRPGDYLALIAKLPEKAGNVLCLGHSPGIETLALRLSGDGDAEDLYAMAGKFPTAGMAVIEFEGGWADIGDGRGRLDRFVRPRLLED